MEHVKCEENWIYTLEFLRLGIYLSLGTWITQSFLHKEAIYHEE